MYAHIEIVDAFLVNTFFGVLAITRHHQVGFGPNLQETHPTPASRTSLNTPKTSGKPKFLEPPKIIRTINFLA